MANPNTERKEEQSVDLAALSDEEIATMSPDEVEASLKAIEEQTGKGDPVNDANIPGEQGEAQSAAAGEEEDTGDVEAGGAADEFQSLNPYADEADPTLTDESADTGNEEDSSEAARQSAEDDQSSEVSGEADEEYESTGDADWKVQYEALMAPFKASGRTVKVESPDDLRRLAQMGYDYTNKMREMKPHLRILKTLEHNNLLEPKKINFAIDLMKGNPEAIKKFLKDSEIDPIELDLMDGAPYEATDHQVSEQQVELDEVLDSIKGTDSFARTAQVITKEWDKPSQDVLMGIPSLIGVINEHMEKGFYDQIANKVQYERSMGRLKGLTDLDAYKLTGDAMQKQGAFGAPAAPGTTTSEPSAQETSQSSKGSESDAAKESKRRKRAASPTKGTASAGKAPPKSYLGDFSDEEIEQMS